MTMSEETPPSTEWDAVADASAEAQSDAPSGYVRRLVKATLTDAAVADLGRELSQEQIDLQAIETLRKAENAKWREEITEVKTRIKGLTEAIRSGVGTKEVLVRERHDPDTGRTELVGVDGVVYDAATDVGAEQRQLTLADAVKGNGAAHEDDDADVAEADDEADGDDVADCDADPADAPLDGSVPEITDPDAVLGAAEDETAAAAPKAKRARKGRRA